MATEEAICALQKKINDLQESINRIWQEFPTGDSDADPGGPGSVYLVNGCAVQICELDSGGLGLTWLQDGDCQDFEREDLTEDYVYVGYGIKGIKLAMETLS